ncbi:SDR family NAD(P)-dependent oxidoreductase [Streptomyces cellulosae]|uniref:SDR family NAD(P)-dependent oxidoreductase n=1 Tax=Streptomyces cellulosae TaxID=1968 RepID=A0ABW7YHS5_STRCE
MNNAGYGLFGAAEEFTAAQIDAIVATNLSGSIPLIRAVLPYIREAGRGRVVQLSSYGGQVAFPGNSMYYATKWGLGGFCESAAQEVAPFGIGVTIVEPGGVRTEFRYGSVQTADPLAEYEGNPAHACRAMLDPAQRPGPRRPRPHGDADHRERRPGPRTPAHGPRLQALTSTIDTLERHLADFRTQDTLAASTDFPQGE